MTKQLSTPERGMAKPFRTRSVSHETHEIIALIPGFMGFDHIGGLSYFAESALAALRGAREAEVQRRVPVVGLSTLPASSLAARQLFLFEQLAQQIELYQPKRIHLLGHSTGGVDAYFATCAHRLDATEWTAQQRAVRAKIASVTTISSPFLGTTLVEGMVAKFLVRPLGQVAPVRELAAASLGVGLLIANNRSTPRRVAEVLESIPSAVGLLHQLLRHRELIDDLNPHKMLERYEGNLSDLDVQRSYYATFVQHSTGYPASRLFRQLYDATAETATGSPEDYLDANKRLLSGAQVIAAHARSPLTLDGSSNDGICNTLRQLPPGARQSEVAALVLGDHLDVMGYFDRVDPLTGRERQTSIFRSGAGFRDNQFFELFGSVAARLN